MKAWQGFGLSLLIALGLHVVILLVPRVAGRGDTEVPTIEVSLATESTDPGGDDRLPSAARKGGAGASAVAAPALAAPAASVQEPAPPREPAVASDSPPPEQASAPSTSRAPESPAATSQPVAAEGGGPAASFAGASSGGSATGSDTGAPRSGGGGAGAGPSGGGQGGTAGAAGSAGSDGSAASMPQPRREIAPRYPRNARDAGWEGAVTIRALIDETGRVVSAEVLASSGHSSLDRSALEAVKRSLFVPARRGGKAVSSTVDIPVRFRLN